MVEGEGVRVEKVVVQFRGGFEVEVCVEVCELRGGDLDGHNQGEGSGAAQG